MDQLSICEMTTYRWSFEEDVQNYVAAGIQQIGVWRQKLSDFGEEKGVELLRESGLSVSSVLWAGGFTGSEGRTHKESIEDAKEALELAAALGAGCLVVYTGARSGHTHNHARRLVRGAISELAPIAAKSNVTLAVEPMHVGCAADWTFLTEIDETLAFIDSVGDTKLKLVFDTYHLGQSAGIVDRLADLVPHIALVQLGDATEPPDGEQNRCPLGDGNIRLREIVTRLIESGYNGAYEVELMGEGVESSSYNDLINRSKQAFREMSGAAT